MSRKKRIFVVLTIGIFLLAALTGCKLENTKDQKIKDLDYTICDESKLPDELVEIIHEKRKEPFKLTYRTKDYLYIVVGYGAQDRKDLSLIMSDLYLTENAIYVDTDFVSEQPDTLEDNLVSYPWIAVKCELYDLQVIFK